jgi:NAD(P)-dependent dehydrogenase (short-subunit alcohol dehydrogenase family)
MMSKALEVVKSFAGKRALITGASSDLGLEFADLLAAQKVNLVLARDRARNEGAAGSPSDVVTIFEVIIREGAEAGEFEVDDPAQAARAVKTAFIPFFHPILIEHAFGKARTPKRVCAR